jgi:3alpha(or 20beta)-hydroxysteroid dehydrogenase
MTPSTGDRLEGKVALITGAAHGQGAAEARRFVAEGARVLVTDVEHREGKTLAAELGKAAAYHPLDVTDPTAWDTAVASASEKFGRIDILINNAGIGEIGLLEALDLETHKQIVDTNLHGVYIGMRAVTGVMKDGGGGVILNISSIDGLVGVLGMTSYTASKFAVTGMTRSAAIELGPYGIRVNSIHPGVIASHMVEQAPAEVRARIDRLMQKQPIKRMGECHEVASLAVFLASDEASYITGAQMVIDGGHLAGPWREPLD